MKIAINRLRLPIFLLLCACLAACGDDNPRCPRLPGGGRYCLQTTAQTLPFDVQQKLDITFNGRRETMIAQLESDALGMRFAGMTPFGQKLIQLDFDNETIKAVTFPGKGFDPALLLALVQIASWPLDGVQAGLDDSTVAEEGHGQRRLVRNGKELIVIGYTRGHPPHGDMFIQLPEAGVELSVENLEAHDTKAKTE